MLKSLGSHFGRFRGSDNTDDYDKWYDFLFLFNNNHTLSLPFRDTDDVHFSRFQPLQVVIRPR